MTIASVILKSSTVNDIGTASASNVTSSILSNGKTVFRYGVAGQKRYLWATVTDAAGNVAEEALGSYTTYSASHIPSEWNLSMVTTSSADFITANNPLYSVSVFTLDTGLATLAGTGSYPTYSASTGEFTFNGTSQYFRLYDLDPVNDTYGKTVRTGTFTLSVWMNASAWRYPITLRAASDQAYTIVLYNNGNANFTTRVGGAQQTSASLNSYMTTGSWILLTIVCSATDSRLYVDGTLRSTLGNTTWSNFSSTAPGQYMFIGANNGGSTNAVSNFFAGKMRGLSLYPSALSDADVASMYAAGYATPVVGFTCYTSPAAVRSNGTNTMRLLSGQSYTFYLRARLDTLAITYLMVYSSPNADGTSGNEHARFNFGADGAISVGGTGVTTISSGLTATTTDYLIYTLRRDSAGWLSWRIYHGTTGALLFSNSRQGYVFTPVCNGWQIRNSLIFSRGGGTTTYLSDEACDLLGRALAHY